MKPAIDWFLDPLAKFGASSGLKANSGGTTNVLKRGIDYHRWVYKTMEVHCKLNLPEWTLLIEPWFRTVKWDRRSPDAVLLHPDTGRAVVVEVKLNWKEQRDEKLLAEYLPIVSSALGVRTYPLMLTNCVRKLKHEPLLGLSHLLAPLTWTPAKPTPTLLLPKRGRA